MNKWEVRANIVKKKIKSIKSPTVILPKLGTLPIPFLPFIHTSLPLLVKCRYSKRATIIFRERISPRIFDLVTNNLFQVSNFVKWVSNKRKKKRSRNLSSRQFDWYKFLKSEPTSFHPIFRKNSKREIAKQIDRWPVRRELTFVQGCYRPKWWWWWWWWWLVVVVMVVMTMMTIE